MLARRGEHDGAEELARRGAELAAPTDALADHADARMALAAVLRAAGREDEAASEAQRALELYREKENAAGAQRAALFSGVVMTEAVAEQRAAESKSIPLDSQQLIRDFIAAWNARDRDALRALSTDDVRYVNKRSIATWDEAVGFSSWLELSEALWESAPDVHYSPPEFVEGDNVVGIMRWRMQGRMETGGGDFALSFLLVGRQRGGRIDYGAFFDEDDLKAARACADGGGDGDGREAVGGREAR